MQTVTHITTCDLCHNASAYPATYRLRVSISSLKDAESIDLDTYDITIDLCRSCQLWLRNEISNTMNIRTNR